MAHSHDGRTHKHSLPATGKNHTHGGAKKKAAPATKHKSAYSIAHHKENLKLVRQGWNSLSEDWYIVGLGDTLFNAVKRGSSGFEGGYKTLVIQQHARLYKGDKDIKTITRVVKVSSADCKRGMGQVRSFKFNGEQLSAVDYANGGSTILDSLGQHICELNS